MAASVTDHLHAHITAMAGPAVQQLAIDPRYNALVEKLERAKAQNLALMAQVAAAQVERDQKFAQAATIDRDLAAYANANAQWQIHIAQLLVQLRALQKPPKPPTPAPAGGEPHTTSAP